MKEILLDANSHNLMNKDYIASFYNEGEFKISFLFTSDFKNTKYLRDYLLMIFDVIWLDMIWKNRFVLIVDELNNNAIEYGSHEGSFNKISFVSKKIWDEIFISIEVQDSGDGKKPKKACEMEELRKQRLQQWFDHHTSIRGRGLFLIITKLVDELYFKDNNEGWLIVGVSKKLKLG